MFPAREDLMHHDTDSVAAVLRMIGEGSESVAGRAADRILRRAEPTARAACRGHGRGLPDARIEELVQDTLFVVWSRIGDFEPEGPRFEAWVRGIAVNVCRNAKRKHTDLLTEDGVLEATDPAQGVLRVLQRAQRQAMVTAAIETALEGVEQDVLYHRYCHDLAREQIAELLGLESADAVRVVLVRARRRLRTALLARLEELGQSLSGLQSSHG
jgi:RNA polymerase sigma factor (sigma-70 family)